MNVKDFTDNIKPCSDLVAFKWVTPQSNGGLILSQEYFKVAIRPGHVLVGEVLATGKNVKSFTKGNRFLIHEYAIKSFHGYWEEGKVYYTEQDQIPATVPDDYVGMTIRK